MMCRRAPQLSHRRVIPTPLPDSRALLPPSLPAPRDPSSRRFFVLVLHRSRGCQNLLSGPHFQWAWPFGMAMTRAGGRALRRAGK